MEFSEKGGMFTGSIDELLKQCSKIDISEVDNDLEKQHAISFIMKELGSDIYEASKIYDDLNLQEFSVGSLAFEERLHTHVKQANDELDILEKNEAIEHIMNELDCDETEATEIYNEIAHQEVKQNIDELVAQGLVEVVGHNEDGEPLFGLTELGKALQQELKKDTDKQ